MDKCLHVNVNDPVGLGDAKEELLAECEHIWKLLEKVPQERQHFNHSKSLNHLLFLEAESLLGLDDKLSFLMTQVRALSAQCHQWQERCPEFIGNNPDTVVKFGKQKLWKAGKDLRLLLTKVVSKNGELEEDMKREQQWLEEQEKMLDMLNGVEEKAKEIQVAEHSQKSISRKNGKFYELQNEMLKLKMFKEKLLNTLGEFLEEHFPLPKEDGIAENKNSGEPAELIKLHEIVEILVDKVVDTPHEPYVTINDSFWAPYIELLLRHGVVLRHPEDPNRIRLEAFDM